MQAYVLLPALGLLGVLILLQAIAITELRKRVEKLENKPGNKKK